MTDLRVGLYGLSREDLEIADFLGMSPYDFSRLGVRPDRPLTDDEKRAEWKKLFAERLSDHRKDMKLWVDADNRVWLGWFRKDGCGRCWIIIAAKVHMATRTVVAVPMRRESDDVAWWRPWMAGDVWERLDGYRRIVPPGVF